MIQKLLDQARVGIRSPSLLDRILVVQRRNRYIEYRQQTAHKIEMPRLFIDVSVISRHDAGTGIQRVVRAILSQILLEPLSGFTVHVVAAEGKRPYHYVDWAGFSSGNLNGLEVDAKWGDIFLGLDFSTHAVYRHRGQLARWKKSGATLTFLIHDLLPEKQPQWFSPMSVIRYRRWIREVVVLADIVFCNSRATENEFLSFIGDRFRLSVDEIDTCVLPMGGDIGQARWKDAKPRTIEKLPVRQFAGQQIILMVGTIEPRKGYDHAVQAFEQLWSTGLKQMLVLIGRPGWKTDKLQEAIRSSRYLGNLLFWFDNASDSFLEQAYRDCNGVLVASYGEGFGLPLIEAAMFKKPVLARKLAVFSEQKLGCVDYFEANSALQLADALKRWFPYLSKRTTRSTHIEKNADWSKTRRSIYEKLARFSSH